MSTDERHSSNTNLDPSEISGDTHDYGRVIITEAMVCFIELFRDDQRGPFTPASGQARNRYYFDLDVSLWHGLAHGLWKHRDRDLIG
jgi:hypothetical protein